MLFKPEALDWFADKFTTDLDYACTNSVRGLIMLRQLCVADHDDFNIKIARSYISKGIFQRYKSGDFLHHSFRRQLDDFGIIDEISPSEENAREIYWSVYSHFLGLLPAVIKTGKVLVGRDYIKWSDSEYRRLAKLAFTAWCDERHESDDLEFMTKHRRMEQAIGRHLFREKHIEKVLEDNIQDTANEILKLLPVTNGQIRKGYYRSVVEEFVDYLSVRLKEYLHEAYQFCNMEGLWLGVALSPRATDQSKALFSDKDSSD